MIGSVNVLHISGADKPNPSQKSGHIKSNFTVYLPEVYVQDIWSRRSQCRTNGQSKHRFLSLSPACYAVVHHTEQSVVDSVVDPDPDWASRIRIHQSEVWIRIRLRIRILLSTCKNSKKNLDSYYFVTLFYFLSLKNDVNVPSKSNKQKKLC